MGRARELTMGPPRRRQADPGNTGPYRTLRILTARVDTDPAELRALIDQLTADPRRKRFGEAAALLDAWARWRDLTGLDEGPRWGQK